MKNFNKLQFVIFVFWGTLLCSFAAIASEGAHGAAHGLSETQIKTIIYQAINVGLLAIGLIYFTRAGVRSFLESRKKTYLEAQEKAQAAFKRAEQEHMELKIKLSKLESNRKETVQRAEAEAADLKRSIVEEARQLSATIRNDAQETARIEIAKAQRQIREYMITQATTVADQQLKTGISKEDHQKLTGKFLTSIEAVQP